MRLDMRIPPFHLHQKLLPVRLRVKKHWTLNHRLWNQKVIHRNSACNSHYKKLQKLWWTNVSYKFAGRNHRYRLLPPLRPSVHFHPEQTSKQMVPSYNEKSANNRRTIGKQYFVALISVIFLGKQNYKSYNFWLKKMLLSFKSFLDLRYI